VRSSGGASAPAALPDPGQAGTLDELVSRLRALKVWAGDPSYGSIVDRINTAWRTAGRPPAELTRKSTVADCFRLGRRRVNVDLLIAVVTALHPEPGYVAQWRQAIRVVLAESPAAAQVRAQDTLPECVADFAGRVPELERLRRVLGRRAGAPGTVVISALEGMAGVGKTQLAIRAGQLLADDEPFDQVLFVDLRGFHPDPGQPPADPATVLDSFLRLLGVSGRDIPHELADRAARYRQQLADRRALVVLDNAADLGQVEPLLPGGASCVTLITSRRSLADLSSAAHLAVDIFPPDQARDLLVRAAPGVPVGEDPDAVGRLARRCGYLPLALALIVGHLRAKPGWTFTDHADWLDERHRDHRVDSGVELALGLSYQHLPAPLRRMFRLLALHPGHDVEPYAAAALADVDLDTAREQLRRLAAEHLLQQSTPGRYVFHDLVRAYATDRASDEDRPRSRRAALTRLFDHYLHTASVAMDTLVPAERFRRPQAPESSAPTPPVADAIAARAWLDAERSNLVAAAGHAAANGWPGCSTGLAAALFRYLDGGGHYSDAITLHTVAGSAARRSGDRPAEAQALTNLGAGYLRLGRFQQAADHLQRALALAGEIGDRRGEARALNNLGASYERLGSYQQAADHYQRALPLFRELGDRTGEAHTLGNLGIVYLRWADYDNAAGHLDLALARFREIGDRSGEAGALDHLGVVYLRSDRHELAVDHHRQALVLFHELGNRSGEAHTLINLGTVYRRWGEFRHAADQQRLAIALFRDIGNPSGEAEALNGLGETLLDDGQPAESTDAHLAALALADRIEDRREQARAHDGLGRTHRASDDEPDRARQHWQQALAGYVELDSPEADQVRINLATLDHPADRTPS
jgi:tetratricopeptide (TPR) repeat protein